MFTLISSSLPRENHAASLFATGWDEMAKEVDTCVDGLGKGMKGAGPRGLI